MKEKPSEDVINCWSQEASAGSRERALTPAWGNFQVVLSVSSGPGPLVFLHSNVLNHKMLIIYLQEILSENMCEVF